MDKLTAELAFIKTRRRQLRDEEYALAERARSAAAQAFARGMSPESVAARLGYGIKAVSRWQKLPPPELPPAAHDTRWNRAEEKHSQKEARREARRRRLLRWRARDVWRRRTLPADDQWLGDCNM
ncbi:hypothetical protein ABZ760_01285 [Streptomyces sp. NPDC006658]|uniref:hypothetical protein n=1 Tax=Streptomyces sp. NPDC006658 TaxID=3156900 RepID=UPI0033EAE0AC